MPPVLLILSEVLQHPLDAALGVGGVGLPFLGLGSGVQDGHGVLGLGAGFHFADIGSGVGWQLWGLGRIAVSGNLSLTDRCDEKPRFFADFEKTGIGTPGTAHPIRSPTAPAGRCSRCWGRGDIVLEPGVRGSASDGGLWNRVELPFFG